MQPYLLFADGEHGTIYRSNLDASGIQQLVTGLPRPIALDFDYRSMQSLVNIKSQSLTWDVNRKLYHNRMFFKVGSFDVKKGGKYVVSLLYIHSNCITPFHYCGINCYYMQI